MKQYNVARAQANAVARPTQLEALSNRLLIERKIKAGAENLLSVFKLSGEKEGLRTQVEAELGAANLKIEALERRVDELQSILDGKAHLIRHRLPLPAFPKADTRLMRTWCISFGRP